VRNLLESDEFVINTVAEPIAEQAQVYADNIPPSISEVDEVGFHTLPSTFVRPARIAESPVHFECRLHKTVEIGNRGSGTHLVVGEVIAVHCADGAVSGHRVGHQAINALGPIAGRGYCRTGDKLDV
jgi:flavin reductase (DIM6/NTAB) family NADH-FMN oxidoreductase RutF